METLANLESFVRSAEAGSFSEAARRLSLTPAAVSRNVSILERNLGIRLFHRTTRRLTLTESGARFLSAVSGGLDVVQAAIAEAAGGTEEPSGILKVSLPPTLGMSYVLPLLPDFLARYPRVRPEWHFENRPVSLVAEGYDEAIGGGFDLSPGVVARTLAPAHLVVVAAPQYMSDRVPPADPGGLAAFDSIVMRSQRTGRTMHWAMRDAVGTKAIAALDERIVLNDFIAIREAAILGLGVALLSVPDVLAELQDGRLIQLLPQWYVDAGAISIYYANREHLPIKTRAFVDFIAEAFKAKGLARSFAGSLG
ncbi:LysR family transcriptional regulator [Aurantimonas sp. HBX-1]|uniref:LysR family transcriptional regulator n=1 Tax=Aurantimonas sp. HBX-1 TaxID=2906072 RepID=UPI001F35AA4A|nr:LysR family transcriptional regulator [Aurantimonas sp. HBX-1]UIJ70606.1 LysR substrate-binding domain-containing protein [Aurantimonas sp. HBX-1]